MALLAAMLLWASSFVALKLAFQAYDPMVVIFGRMAVASLCVLVFWPKLRQVRWRRRDLKTLTFMVGCEPCLYFLFEARALENTTASQAGMITALLPLLVAAAAGVVLQERVTRRMAAGFFVALAGVGWLSLGGESSPAAPAPLLGNVYELLAMLCATGYTVSLKRLTARVSPLVLTGLQALAGSVFFLPFLFLPTTQLPSRLAPVPALAVVYLGACITLGAYGLYNFAVSRMPASQASAFGNLIPVFAVALGWLILGERFTLAQWAASALVFAGVFLSQDLRPASTPEPAS